MCHKPYTAQWGAEGGRAEIATNRNTVWGLGEVELRFTFSLLARVLLETEASQSIRRTTRRRRAQAKAEE